MLCVPSRSSSYALVRHWYFPPTIRSTVCVLIRTCDAVFLFFEPRSTCASARSRRFLRGVDGKYCTSRRARFGLRTVAFLSVANRLAAVIGALAPPALAVLVPGASLLVLCVVPLCVS